MKRKPGHFHLFVWHRHDGWHPPRGRHTRGWHGHVWFRHEHEAPK